MPGAIKRLDVIKHWRDVAVLQNIGDQLMHLSKVAATVMGHEDPCVSTTARRVHLMVEELGEFIMGSTDPERTPAEREEAALDGLCDLEYVLNGTAEECGLPLRDGFAEVHRSNMTKAPRKPGDPRVRDKGPDYTPPDLKQYLR